MESFIFTALLGFVMMVPLMFTLLGWFSTSMEAESCHKRRVRSLAVSIAASLSDVSSSGFSALNMRIIASATAFT